MKVTNFEVLPLTVHLNMAGTFSVPNPSPLPGPPPLTEGELMAKVCKQAICHVDLVTFNEIRVATDDFLFLQTRIHIS